MDDILTPERTLIDDRPFWLWPDGTLLPVVSGGDGSAEGGGGGEGGAGNEGGEGSGTEGGDGGQGEGSGSGSEGGDGGEGNKVEFTPEQRAEMGRRIAEERAKAKTAAEAAAKKAIEQAAERAKMDEAQRLKAEKEDAEAAAKTATEKANRKLVSADAKVAAVALGVPADRADAFVRLADLTEVTVDDDGVVDAKALAKAVKKTLDDNPFLKADTNGGAGRSGGEMNGGGGQERAKTLEDAVAARYAS